MRFCFLVFGFFLLIDVGGGCQGVNDGGGFADSYDSESESDPSSGDSDGDTDSDTDSDTISDSDNQQNCDCPGLEPTGPAELAKALNACPGLGILGATTYSSSPFSEEGYGLLESMGSNDCLVAPHGCQMLALSTGPVGQYDPNDCSGMEFGDGSEDVEDDPLPPFQGLSPTTSSVYESCDVVQLRLSLEAPAGAEGFAFDFLFASSEYPEWLNQGFNDAFYAILVHPDLNGGQPTNISFDDNDNEIEVDVNFFENPEHPCNEAGSGWQPLDSGSTGWLRTSWPVAAGTEMQLIFSIHDEGDCLFDSIVFIDNFQWLGDPVTGGTVAIE
jgi:hypothetical protein